MTKSRLRVLVYCEDREHEAFARAFLRSRFDIHGRRVRVDMAPAGKGAASDWVERQYPGVVHLARAKKSQGKLGFLVIVDGDNVGVAGRKAALDGQVEGGRDADARIAIWVPTWEIETWVLWLCGERVDGDEVDERRSYKHHVPRNEFSTKAKRAAEAWDRGRANESQRIPSLTDAREELRRIT